MTAYRIAGYDSWSSPITSDFVAAELIGLADLRIVGGAILLDRSIRRRTDGTIEDVTPAPYNVRTRVHEYGGAAYIIAGDTVFFSNFADQRLDRLDPGGAPRPFSTRGGTRYADALPLGQVETFGNRVAIPFVLRTVTCANLARARPCGAR